MKKLTIVGIALALALGAAGCKKKESGPGVARPGDPSAADGGCCGTSSSPESALLPLGLVGLGLVRLGRRRR
jgi:MYXO-CTERM domain-containing protein